MLTDAPSSVLYVLDSSNGLGSNQIHRIARDLQARLLLATPVGLIRFDGSFTHAWNRQNALRCNGMRSATISPDGRIWAGTDLGLEVLDADGVTTNTVTAQNWQFGLCQHIDASGPSCWAGTPLGLLRLQRTPASLGYEPTFIADVGFVNAIYRFNEQRVLAATVKHGLVESDGSAWWPFHCEALTGRKVFRVLANELGHILVGTDRGVYVIDDSSRGVIARLDLPAVNPAVTAMAVAHDRYWVAFGRFLVAFPTAQNPEQSPERFTVESEINDLLVDELDNCWIATNTRGLAKVSCLRSAVERLELGRAGSVYSIKPGGGDMFTIGGEQLFGRIAVDDDGPNFTASTVGLPDTIAWDSLEEENGTWVATQSGLFYAACGNAFTQILADDVLLGAPGRTLAYHRGAVWAGTLRGLAKITDGKAEHVDGGGAALGYIYVTHLDDTGALWIGTLGRGLWRECDGMHQITCAPLSATANTYAIEQGPDGRFIILQDEYVLLMDRDFNAHIVAALPPVAGWTVCWVDARTVAIGASDGLRILDLSSGRVTRTVNCLFPLRSWEFTNNRSLVRDQQGRFLCGVTSGLVRVDTERLSRFAPPLCKLGDIVWKGVEPLLEGTNFTVRPGRWSFTVSAYSAWWVDSGQVRYQFRLVGFDDLWSQPADRPEILFTSLPPGDYRLLGRAHSALAGMGPETLLIELNVRQPFWALGWSPFFVAMESGYDWLVRSRARNRLLLQANRDLERAVEERTNALQASNQDLTAMRDAFQRMSEIDALTGLGNRRNFEKEMRRTTILAQRLNLPLTLLMVDVDHFKRVNDEYGHPVGDQYLRRVAEALSSVIRVAEDVATRFGGEEFALLLVNTDVGGAVFAAERVRVSVAGLELPNARAPLGVVTVSIGLATMRPNKPQTAEALIAAADHALYMAKSRGRNRVEVSPEP